MEGLRADLELTVQFDEIDSFRIAHHTKLVAYLERPRIRLLANIGFDMVNPPFAAAIYSMNLDFKKTARLLDNLQVSSQITGIEGFKLILTERILRRGSLLLKAKTSLVFLDWDSQSPVPLSSVLPDLPGVVL